jgi:hypothetical protein
MNKPAKKVAEQEAQNLQHHTRIKQRYTVKESSSKVKTTSGTGPRRQK